MTHLLLGVWFLVSSVVAIAKIDEYKEEKQTVRLFEQTEYGYRTYSVKVDR